MDPDATRPLEDSAPPTAPADAESATSAPEGVDDGAPRSASVGSLLGRYVLLEELGRGGGGRVFTAFDTELERKVALKLLMPGTSLQSARREARALAKLDHPHVVRIFDVGQAHDPLADSLADPLADPLRSAQPFIAMELMPGGPFESFCASAPPRHVFAALRDIASAIAAAHAAHLIHGDIKPSNLLRSADGVTKLSDFGVARRGQHDGAAAPLAGTRWFLSPELFQGRPASPASDQYAFCLTAWIALHGRHPWHPEADGDPTSAGSNVDATGQSSKTTETAEGSPGFDAHELEWESKGLPRGATAALARGLHPDPQQRWDTMAALCEALQPPEPTARRGVVLGGFALGTMALVAAGASMANPTPACDGAGGRVEELWSPQRREDVRAQLAGPGYATLRARVDTVLDGYATAWADMSRTSCEATHVHHTQSAELLDLRSACLRHALAAFEVTTDLLRDGGDDVRLGAHELVEGLPPLAPCADPAKLRDTIALPDDPAQRESVFEARAALGRVEVLRVATRFADAAAVLEQLAPDVERLAYGPLTLELAYATAYLEHAQGRNDDAVARAAAALATAWEIGDLDRARELAVLLSFVYSTELEQYDSAAIYGDVARGLSKRPGTTAPKRAAALAVAAMHHAMAGDYPQAMTLQRAAIEAYGTVEDVTSASFRNDLAVIYHYAGDLESATAEHEAALALRSRLLGERHPEVAQSLDNLAQVDYDAGRFDAAESLARRARSILLETLPADHSRVLKNGNTLANALVGQDRWDEALPLIRDAHDGFEAQLGPDHPLTGMVRGSLGIVYEQLGQTDKALALLAEAVRVQVEARGADHPALVLGYSSYGAALSRDGQHDEAMVQLQRGVDLAGRTIGLEHDHAVSAFGQLALAKLRAKRFAEAAELADEGLARLATRDPPLPQEAKALRAIKAKALSSSPW